MRRREAVAKTFAALVVGLASCRDVPRAPDDGLSEVQVNVRSGAIIAPDSARAGWTRVSVSEAEDAHIVVIFRLPATTTESDVRAFVAALDTAPSTPPPGTAIGGPEVGTEGSVIVQLTPGVYVLACVRRDDDGHRHASRGETRMLTVRSAALVDSAAAGPPPSTHTLRMVDFAYIGADRVQAGPQLIRIENAGKQDHQVRLARLRKGASLQSWMSAEDPESIATTMAGMARVGPGEVAYLPVDLTSGSYVAYCLIADANTKRPHVALGMLRAIEVP